MFSLAGQTAQKRCSQLDDCLDLSDGLIFDTARIRLLEIGEAVKALPDDLLATQPPIPWRQIARMRGYLTLPHFDTAHAILRATVDEDLPDREHAVQA